MYRFLCGKWREIADGDCKLKLKMYLFNSFQIKYNFKYDTQQKQSQETCMKTSSVTIIHATICVYILYNKHIVLDYYTNYS